MKQFTLTLSLLFCTSLANANALLPDSFLKSENSKTRQEQRKLYLSAQQALKTGRLTSYRQMRPRLEGYPLTVYLDFSDIQRRLNTFPEKDVERFLARYPESQQAAKLRRQWVAMMAQNQRWDDFDRFYDDETATPELKCMNILGRLRRGEKEAIQETADIWNVGHSLPKPCDPLFEQWTRQGLLTQGLVRSRFDKALQEGNRSLASYLAKKLKGEDGQIAQLYLEIDQFPERLSQQQRFQKQTPAMQAIILHGIQRLAPKDPLQALKRWQHFDAQQLFPDGPRRETQQLLALELLKRDHLQAADRLVQDIPGLTNDKVVELLVRDALRQLDWKRVYETIQRLPEAGQNDERWKYWRARAIEETGIAAAKDAKPKDLYKEVAMGRSFYGFLAADRIGGKYELSDVPAKIRPEVLLAVANHPGSQRTREFRALNDNLNANREWYYMTQNFKTEEELLAAAKLASQWGWYHQSILSMAHAQYWDDLQVRFPLPYNEPIFAAAHKHQVSPLLLYSVARQESAFAESIRSPAGALGLMQLMPKTAQSTAKKAGIALREADLLKPEKNIQLGSYYLTELLKQFDGNRILAVAAYNAGPYRVGTWLKRSSNSLPADVWIETIPFRETRQYVQNVLAYQVIYGYRTGTIPSMLTHQEVKRTL